MPRPLRETDTSFDRSDLLNMTRSRGPCVVETVWLSLLLLTTKVSAQSLDTRTATYILAGIAGLYTLITFFCLLVTICLCCYGRRKLKNSTKRHLKYVQYEELGEVSSRPPLPPVYEYPELESPIIPNGEYGLFFANEHAEEVKEEMNDKVIEAVTDEIFVNQSACESDFSGTEGHKQDSSVVINNDATNVNGREVNVRQDTQTAISWNWNNVFNKEQEDIKHSPKTGPVKKASSTTDNKPGDLRMRKFDGTSYADDWKKMPQGKRSKSKKVNILPESVNTHEPMTSPLPRSGKPTKTSTDKVLNLSTLHAALSSVATKWYSIGVQLKVSRKTLSAIGAINKNNTDMCMMRVCDEWLTLQRKCDRVPEWITVVQVLRSRVVLETELADSLHEKYCCDDKSDEEEEPTSKSYTWIN